MLGVKSSQETSSVVFPSVTWSVPRPRSGESVQPSAKDLLATLTAVLQPVLPSVPTGEERSAGLEVCQSAMEFLDVVQNTLMLYLVPVSTLHRINDVL